MARSVSRLVAPFCLVLLANLVLGARTAYEVDLTPPSVLSSLPRDGAIFTTNDFVLSVTTDEASLCRFGFEDAGFLLLPYQFTETGASHIISMSLGEGGYSIYVRCRDVHGTGGNEMKESYVISFIIDTNPPLPIHTISAGNYEGRVFLTWIPASDTGSGVASQMLFRKSPNTEYTNIINLSPSATVYVDTTASPDDDYTYLIRSLDFAGNVQERGASVSTKTIAPASITAQLLGAPAAVWFMIAVALLLVFFGAMFLARRILR
ncbi:MAG: hypothetical protein AB1468_01755 [Candidatus Micrarchaeota archaeon]